MQLRLLAPFLPFVTAEVWSWWQEGSVHRTSWPEAAELGPDGVDPRVLDLAARALAGVRGAKSTAKVGMRTEVSLLTVRAPQADLDLLSQAIDDVRAAGKVTGDVALEPGTDADLHAAPSRLAVLSVEGRRNRQCLAGLPRAVRASGRGRPWPGRS